MTIQRKAKGRWSPSNSLTTYEQSLLLSYRCSRNTWARKINRQHEQRQQKRQQQYAIQNPSEHPSGRIINLPVATINPPNLLFSVSRLNKSQDSSSQRLDWHLQASLIRCPIEISSTASRPVLGLALPQAFCWHCTPRRVDGANGKRRARPQRPLELNVEARSYRQISHG